MLKTNSFGSLSLFVAVAASLAGCGAKPDSLPSAVTPVTPVTTAAAPSESTNTLVPAIDQPTHGWTGDPAGPATATPAAQAPTTSPARTPATSPTSAPVAARPVLQATGGVQPISGTSTSLTVSLSAGRQALLALAAGDGSAGNLTVNPTPVTNAYRLAAVPDAATDPEAAVRRYDARFTGLRHHPGYSLQDASATQVGDEAPFWVMVQTDTTQADRQVQAHCAYVGSHCLIMVDDQVGASLDVRARQLGQTFDNQIYPTDTGLFGAPVATGSESRVTVLLSPEVDDHGNGRTLGYFTLRDLFSPSDAPNLPELQHSNQRLMLYEAADIAAAGRPADYLGTLAHELQHLINGSHKVANGAPAPEDTWLDEGLAMYAMQANGFGLNSDAAVLFDHVRTYLASPEQYSLTRWDLDPGGNAYGAVYLFVTYLVDRYGEGVLKQLVAAREAGEANIDARLTPLGSSFDQLFRDWVAANAGATSAAPGYKQIDLHGTYGAGTLAGVTPRALSLPSSASLSLLPRSASYYTLDSATGGSYNLGLAGTLGSAAEGWLVTP